MSSGPPSIVAGQLRLVVKRTNERCVELPESTSLSLLTVGKKQIELQTEDSLVCLHDRKIIHSSCSTAPSLCNLLKYPSNYFGPSINSIHLQFSPTSRKRVLLLYSHQTKCRLFGALSSALPFFVPSFIHSFFPSGFLFANVQN